MQNRISSILIVAFVVILLVCGAYYIYVDYYQNPAPNDILNPEEAENIPPVYFRDDEVGLIVASFQYPDNIMSPLRIIGEARGWFFEGSFPVFIEDGNGKEIARALATAETDWMTSDYVRFEAFLTFEKPTTDSGTLVLRADNPSGLAENEEVVRVPVKFKK